MFPSLAAKFLYDDESGETGCFQLTKVREGKGKSRFARIDTVYDWSGRQLLTKEEHLAKMQGVKAKPKTEANFENVEANKDVPEDFLMNK